MRVNGKNLRGIMSSMLLPKFLAYWRSLALDFSLNNCPPAEPDRWRGTTQYLAARQTIFITPHVDISSKISQLGNQLLRL